MRTTFITAAALALAGLSTAAVDFDASANTNVVTYWGQGANQDPLLSYCENPNIDIINIGFVNVFPDQGNAGWPGTNFGNACGSETYTYKNISTELLSNCPDIGPDIVLCQQMYGTKILLSIGGAGANGYNDDDDSAANFARFLWGAFGPSLAEWTDAGGPRPFGSAVVDGFDFDIESELSSDPVVNGTTLTDYQSLGWATMVNTFKNELFTNDTSKSYYLSAAPQCVIPDVHLSNAIANAWFDFIWVQFYNTASCSARSALSSSSKRASGFTAYDDWTEVTTYNPDVKIYIGLPASTASASEATYYLDPADVDTLVSEVYTEAKFGGIMLWEASTEATNILCGKDYATWMKEILESNVNGTTLNTDTDPCPAQTISTDGTCGPYNGYTCAGSIFGQCCSIYGYCGDTSEYCDAATCDSNNGDCGDESIGVITGDAVSNTTSNGTSTTTSSTLIASSTGNATAYTYATAGAVYATTSADPASSTSVVKSTVTGNSVSYGNATAGASYATASSDPASTTTVVTSTISRTVSTTNAAGESTVYVTDDVTVYTTYCPVTAAEAAAASASAASVSAAEAFAASASTTTVVTSTSTRTVSTTNSAGESTVYVTEDVTSYTTYCPVTAAEASASSASAESASAASASAAEASTTSVYSQVSIAADDQSTSAQSTTYSTTTVHATSTIYRTRTVTSSISSSSSEAAAVYQTPTSDISSVFTAMSSSILSSSSFAALYALGNSSSTASSTATAVVKMVTATIVPVQAEVSDAAVAASNSTVSGVASATLSYTYSPSSSTSTPAYAGGAVRVEYGFGAAAALAVGALFAL